MPCCHAASRPRHASRAAARAVAHGHAALPELVGQRTGQQLHGGPRVAALLAGAVEEHDVRVTQPRDHPHFAQEPLAAFRRRLRVQHLQRHRAIQPRVGGAIDDGVAARAERLLDAVAAKLGAERAGRAARTRSDLGEGVGVGGWIVRGRTGTVYSPPSTVSSWLSCGLWTVE